MSSIKDLKGKRFGRLLVINDSGKRQNRAVVWLCKCDCGELTEVRSNSLVGGRTRSCGCLIGDVAVKTHTKHGHTTINWQSPTYRSWANMKNRCLCSTYREFEYYGGRGITVCDRWKYFENFLEDMGEKPENKTLNRIDNDGNYEPNNCEWATPLEQANNRRPMQRRKNK